MASSTLLAEAATKYGSSHLAKVQEHLKEHGARLPDKIYPELCVIRERGEKANVELSPWMKSMLRMHERDYK